MRVGFTGSRKGMTNLQKAAVRDLLAELSPTEVHHGDAVGADAEFHELAAQVGARRVIHPPTNSNHRAFCQGEETRGPGMYVVRDHDIVDETQLLIGAPQGFKEQMRSGTWSTIRYARKRSAPVLIVWPDGSSTRVDAQTPSIRIRRFD